MSRVRFALLFILVIACFAIVGFVVPTLIRDHRISIAQNPQDLAVAASAYGHTVIIISGDENGPMEIDETLATALDNSIYRYEVAQDCFNLQKVFWTRYPGMSSLSITIEGPMQDGSFSLFGSCTMQQVNAVNQDWSQVNASSAWAIYDAKSIGSAIAS